MLLSTCRPFCQSVVDVMDDSVSRESHKPLHVQSFQFVTILTDLPSERRKSITQILAGKKHLRDPDNELTIYNIKLQFKYHVDMISKLFLTDNLHHKITFYPHWVALCQLLYVLILL